MIMISEYKILSYIKNNVPVTEKQIMYALAITEGDEEEIRNKVQMMLRFDVITINNKGEIRAIYP